MIFYRNQGHGLRMWVLMFICISWCTTSIADGKSVDAYDIRWLITKDGLPDNSIRQMVRDENGFLWLATLNGLSRYDGYTFLNFQHEAKGVSLKGNRLRDLEMDARHRLWIGSAGDKVSCIDLKQGHFVDFKGKHDFNDTYKDAAGHRICIVDNGDGTVWRSSYGDGLFLLEKQTGRELLHITKANSGGWLKTDYLLSLLTDGYGGLWVGTEYVGLAHITPHRQIARFIEPFAHRSPESNHIRVLTVKEGKVFMGNSWKQLAVVNEQSAMNNGQLSIVTTKFLGTNVSALVFAPQGIPIIGLRGSGLIIDNTPYHHSDDDPTSLSYDEVFSLLVDSKCRLWIGTLGRGLDMCPLGTSSAFGKGKGKTIFRHFFGDTFGNRRIRCLCPDLHGNIWMGTSDGLYIFNPDSLIHNPKAYRHYNMASGHLKSDEIRCIRQTRDGTMYIAETGYGIAQSKFVSESLSIKHFGVREGLISAMTMSMEEDRFGQIWISTEDGISCFLPRIGTFVHTITIEGSMGRNVYSENSSCRLPDGRLLFGSHEGITTITPIYLNNQTPTPKVKFTYLTVNGFRDPSLSLALAYEDRLELNHNENSIEIGFSPLNLGQMTTRENANGLSLQYEYFMEGYDNGWSQPTIYNKVQYKNLPPGTYRLHVRTVGNPAKDCESVLTIIINRPWWSSWWSWCIYLLIAAFIGWLAFMQLRRYYRQRIRNRIEAEVAVQLKQKNEQDFMERLTNIVNREIANENFSVDEIAREMLVNRTTFYDRVKTLTGMAPNAYLRTVRMKRAAEMLSTTDTPVSEVAYSVGFSSPQYFSKVFKQEFDMTPTDYINKFRGKMD